MLDPSGMMLYGGSHEKKTAKGNSIAAPGPAAKPATGRRTRVQKALQPQTAKSRPRALRRGRLCCLLRQHVPVPRGEREKRHDDRARDQIQPDRAEREDVRA